MIRSATKFDLSGLVRLNQQYFKVNVPASDLNNGFLGYLYNYKEFQLLINDNAVVVCEIGNLICGYYLINTCCLQNNHQKQTEVLQMLIEMELIKPTIW